MTQMQLIQHISTFDNFGVVKFRNKLREQSFSLSELVDLSFHSDPQVAQKASRILQFIIFKFPVNYVDEVAYFIEHVAEVDCTTCRKQYAKALLHLTSPEIPKEVRNKVKELDLEPIVELCFRWLKDTSMITAVRASAAETLFNLRHRYPWIAEALSRELEAMMIYASPMLKNKGNYILSYLHCED
jgi:hypothetical protein